MCGERRVRPRTRLYRRRHGARVVLGGVRDHDEGRPRRLAAHRNALFSFPRNPSSSSRYASSPSALLEAQELDALLVGQPTSARARRRRRGGRRGAPSPGRASRAPGRRGRRPAACPARARPRARRSASGTVIVVADRRLDHGRPTCGTRSSPSRSKPVQRPDPDRGRRRRPAGRRARPRAPRRGRGSAARRGSRPGSRARAARPRASGRRRRSARTASRRSSRPRRSAGTCRCGRSGRDTLRDTCWTRPAPPQDGHVIGDVPGAAPLPPQRTARAARPDVDLDGRSPSSGVGERRSRRRAATSGPRAGPARRRPRPPKSDSPKNAPKTSERLPKSTSIGAKPPPRSPSWPNRS